MNDKSPQFEVKKQLILHLKEDTIQLPKPVNNTKRKSQRSKSTGERTFEETKQKETNKKLMIHNKNLALCAFEEQTNSCKKSQNCQKKESNPHEKYHHNLLNVQERENNFSKKENTKEYKCKSTLKYQPKKLRYNLPLKYNAIHDERGKISSSDVHHPYLTLSEVR